MPPKLLRAVSATLAVGLIAMSSQARAQAATTGGAPPSAAALRAGLAGEWTGALGYRDYQTDELNELPVETTISTGPDGVTHLRLSKFDDGPKRGAVWITTVSLEDPKTSTITSASFRSGRTPELETETVAVTAYASPTRWTIVYSQTGSDDDKPAEIRVTETRDGADLLSVKEVRSVGAPGAWRFRNQTKLRLLRPTALAGADRDAGTAGASPPSRSGESGR